MAITDSTLPYRELQKTAATHRCPEHPKFALQVAWRDGQYVIVCSDHEPDQLQPIRGLTQMYKQGEGLPLPVANRIENNLKRRNQTMDKALSIIDAATGKLAPPDQIERALAVAESLELNPLLGHICLYQGNPWVEIDGWYYRLRRKYGLTVDLRTRPLNEQERRDQDVADHQHVWKAEVVKVATGQTIACGYGYSSTEEPWHKSPVEKLRPQRLAEKRAEEDAIRKVVPPGVSLGPDSVEGELVITRTDQTTHLGPAPEPTETLASAPPAPKPQTETEGPLPEDAPERFPLPPLREDVSPTMKTFNDLLKRAYEAYELQPKKVYGILGVKSSIEVADLEAAWSLIEAHEAE